MNWVELELAAWWTIGIVICAIVVAGFQTFFEKDDNDNEQ